MKASRQLDVDYSLCVLDCWKSTLVSLKSDRLQLFGHESVSMYSWEASLISCFIKIVPVLAYRGPLGSVGSAGDAFSPVVLFWLRKAWVLVIFQMLLSAHLPSSQRHVLPKKAHQYIDISCTSSRALFAEAKQEIPTPPAVKMLIWLSMVKRLVITDPVVLKERIVVSVLMLYIF